MSVATSSCLKSPTPSRRNLRIALPPAELSLRQNEEWCVVYVDGKWREMRLHDYEQIFSVPGLYESIIYDVLKCDSPARIRELLESELAACGTPPGTLRALDLGAGNGMVGEELADMGVELVVGVDIIEEAAAAAERDRPGVYQNYHVVDMTQLDQGQRRELTGYKFNCLTCVAALGFGDIPTKAFANAYNLVEDGGWIAFNIKSSFLDPNDKNGFGRMINAIIADKLLDVRKQTRYRHRVGTDRKPIEYTAIVGNKTRDILPEGLLG